MLNSIHHGNTSTIHGVVYAIFAASALYVLSFFIVPSISPVDSHAAPNTDLVTTLSISPSNTAAIELMPGLFKSSDPQTIEVSTNNYSGYTLSISTNASSTDLVNIEDSELVIPTIELDEGEESKTSDTFPFGYGYSIDGTNFKPVPGFTQGDSGQVAVSDIIGFTDEAGTSTTNLSFGIKTNRNTAAGTYQSQFQLTATVNDIGYIVQFTENAGEETVTNMPEDVIGTFNGAGVSIDIEDITPNRYPYTFLGWSEDQTLTDESVLYQPGEVFILDPTEEGVHTLYAQWDFRCHPDATTISNSKDTTILTDAICMQDMNITVARNMIDEVQYTLYDSRDQKPYFISMLKDGNVWMTQNLDLGDDEKTYTLTSADTDLEEGETFVLPAASDLDVVTFDTEIYEAEQQYVVASPVFREAGDKYYVSDDKSVQITTYESLEECKAEHDEETCRHYHAGNYYSSYVATAGRVLDSRQTDSKTEIAPNSICPAGWRLMTAVDAGYKNSKSLRNLIENGYGGIYGASNTSTIIMMGRAPFYHAKASYYYGRTTKLEDDSYEFEEVFIDSPRIMLQTDTISQGKQSYEYYGSYYNQQLLSYYEASIRCIARDNTNFDLTINYRDRGELIQTETLNFDSENPGATHIGSNEPTRDGYTFIGWALEPDSDESTYRPGDPIYYSTKTIPISDQTLDLYAVWEEEPTNNLLTTISTMQEMTPAICNGTATPSINSAAPSALLTDTRDGKQYWVSKLADGNCWMTQNLNLGDAEVTYTLTPEDSDVANNFTLPAENSIEKQPVLNRAIYHSLDYTAVVGQEAIRDLATCEERYGENACMHYSVGKLYNFYTATAGTGGLNQASGEAPDSICPLGWMLPSNTGAVSFQSVIDAYDLRSQPAIVSNKPTYFVKAGSFFLYSSSVGSYGVYHARNILYLIGSREIDLSPTEVNYSNYYSTKVSSKSVRCVARSNATYTLSFNNNGGSGSPAAITSEPTNTGHNSYTIPVGLGAPTRSGYTFAGWNTKADGTGVTIQPGENFSVSGSATLYATWNFTLNYDANGGSNAPESETRAGGSTKAFTVSSTEPTNGNKIFLGWSKNPDSNSPLYLKDSIITANTPTTTLYAIWGGEELGLATINTMQEMTPAVCEATSIHYSKQLTDTRDGKKYWVSKLADGNCWMTQNLDLGSKETSYTLTPVDSDVMDDFVLPISDETTAINTVNYDQVAFRTSTEEYTTPRDLDEMYVNTSLWYSLAECTEGSGLSEEDCRHYHVGSYYNYYAATAGTGTSGSQQYDIASSSICPSGWRLPLGRSSASSLVSEYSKLLFAEGVITSASNSTSTIVLPTVTSNDRFEASPLYFTRVGYASSNTSRSNHNMAATYWESTSRSSSSADHLYYYIGHYVAPQYSMSKSYGASVRCIARSNSVYTLSYDANGGEDAPISQTSAAASTSSYTFIINPASPTRSGFTFAGWNTKADGTGETYQPGEEFIAHNSTTLYATWNFTLRFDANGGSNAPETVTKAGGETATFTIDGVAPTKENAYFWGWSTSPDSEFGNYSPLSKITVDAVETVLYAIWQDTEIPLETITYMQEINSNICRETPVDYSKQLIDQRDGKSYWVSKLADGNCWMTQNLDLGDAEQDYLLTPEDSDVNENFLLVKKDYSKPIINNEGNEVRFNDGDVYYVIDGNYLNNHTYTTVEECAESETNLNEETCKHYHSGNQYNYYTATAGSITMEDYANTEASSSICPSGWRLPAAYNNTKENVKSHYNLYFTAYGIENSSNGSLLAIEAPLYVTPVYSYDEMVTLSLNFGGYWSSAAGSTASGRTVEFNSSRFTHLDASNKATYGYNVRCVARNNPVDYIITYNYQDGETEPKVTTAPFDGETRNLKIEATAPEREGYIFLGWGTSAESTEPTYMPGDLFDEFYTNSNMPTSNQSLDLYAIWEASTNLLTTISTMQEMTPAICSGTTTPSTNYGAPSALLTDTRDGKQYWVSKLADGQCWMTQNLDLGSKETAYTLTPENSDVASNFELPIEPTTPFDTNNYNVVNFRNLNLFTVTGKTDWADYVYKSEAECNAIYGEGNTICDHYYTGGYYNWYTATAGAGLKEMTADYTQTYTSICPSGWRLPYGKIDNNTPSEFSTLAFNYDITTTASTVVGNIGYAISAESGLNTIRSNPLYFIRGGYYNGNALTSPQTNAYYHTSNNRTSQYEYGLYFVSSNIQTNAQINKYNGFNVRCVARKSETFTLYYDENGGISAPASQSKFSSIGHVTMTLSSVLPERLGYTFKGYSRNKDAETADYQPGDSISFAEKNLRLYAVWEKNLTCHPNATTIGDIHSSTDIEDATKAICMQDMNTVVAQSMVENQQYQLVDIRDNTVYFVARLKDGNVWMTQNLDLGNSTRSYTLTPSDSDVEENYVLPTATKQSFDAYSFNQTNFRDPGDIFYVTSGDSTADIQVDSVDACSALNENLTNSECRHYHAGNYYNWYTATAGTGTSSIVNNYETAGSSICPAGWGLPQGLSTVTISSDYPALLYQYDVISSVSSSTGNVGYKAGGLNAIRTAPLYFNRPGYYNGTAISYPKTEATYWTSTNWNNTNTLGLHFFGTNIRTNYTLTKQIGRNIRCVAKNTAISYTVNYHQNDGTDSVTSETVQYTGKNLEVKVKAEAPTREGYIFLGWGTSANDTAPSYVQGQLFEASNIINMPTSNQSLDLYAIWEASTNLLTTISTMQEMTPAICSGTTTPSTNYGAPSALLTDTRDGKQYWVSKLADGQCWMTQNLDLGSKETAYTLTPEDSDVAENFTLPAEDQTILFDINHYNVANLRDLGDRYHISSNKATADTDWILFSKERCESVYSVTYCQHYHVGNYYNWYTATAGTGVYNYNVNYSTLGSSICPAGWRLPEAKTLASTGSDFAKLLTFDIVTSLNKGTGGSTYQTNGSRTLRSTAIYANRAGYYNNNALGAIATNGYYWTPTVYNSTSAYGLNFTSTAITPNSAMAKYQGRSIRCVARAEESQTLTYNANGGDVAPTAQTSNPNNLGHATFTLDSSVPTRSGFTFVGWNEQANGSGRMFQPGDSYAAAGNITLYAIWSYTLTYDINGGDSATPASITANDGESHIFTIDTTIPTKEGSTFLGWSEDPTATAGNYYAGSTLRTTSPLVTLYAIWGSATAGLENISTMQEMTNVICANTPTGYTKQLEDIRDRTIDPETGTPVVGTGTKYWVAKLADGNCWMTQNLNFTPVAGRTYYGNDADPNHIPDTDIGFGTSDATNKWIPESVSATETLTTATANQYIYRDLGDRYYVPNNTVANDISYTSKEACEAANDSATCEHYHVGNYYNWYTAVAGSGTYGAGANYTSSNNSICPYGWRLPKGRTSSTGVTEYADLIRTYGAVASTPANTSAIALSLEGLNILRNDPLYITRAGYHYNTRALDNGGNRMYYWTSANYDKNNAYILYSSESAWVSPNTYGGKQNAFSVRCVASEIAPAPTATAPEEPEPTEPEPSNPEQSGNSSEPSAPENTEPAVQPQFNPAPAQTNSVEPNESTNNSASTSSQDETANTNPSTTNPSPLGVKKTNDGETVTSEEHIGSSDDDAINTVAIVSAAVAATTGIILLATSKRRKKNDKEAF